MKHETTAHFLASCSTYKDHRIKLLEQNQWQDRHAVMLPAMLMGEMISTGETENLLKFIYKSFLKRERIVNDGNGRNIHGIHLP